MDLRRTQSIDSDTLDSHCLVHGIPKRRHRMLALQVTNCSSTI